MTDPSSKQQLAEALHAVVTDQAEQQAASRRRSRRPDGATGRGMLMAACAGWGALLWLWVARPAWLVAPPDLVRPTTATEREASARYAIYLEYARVERFRAANGRMPASLGEAGPTEHGVVLRVVDGGYLLESQVDAKVLRLTDRMNADSFLGDAISRLPRRPQ